MAFRRRSMVMTCFYQNSIQMKRKFTLQPLGGLFFYFYSEINTLLQWGQIPFRTIGCLSSVVESK